MNRVRLGIAVLLALVLLSSASAWLVRSETSRLLNDLDQLRETVLQSPEQAEQAFQQFHDQWEKSERRLNLVVWRDKVVQIDVTVAHLTPMLGADCDELDSELSEGSNVDPAAERKRDAVLVEYPIDKGKAWCADTVPFAGGIAFVHGKF